MRGLYISYYLPPLGRAESRHNLAWLRGLSEQGIELEVITADQNEVYSRDASLADFESKQRVNYHRILKRPAFFRYTQYIRNRIGLPNFTDDSGWKSGLHNALEIHKEKPFDFIYTVFGIPSALKLGTKLKQQLGLPLVIEFRDPLHHNFILQKYLKEQVWPLWKSLEAKRIEAFERKCVTAADLVVVESPIHDMQLVSHYGLSPEKVVPWGAGFDPLQIKQCDQPMLKWQANPVIGYVGALYSGYESLVSTTLGSLKILEDEGAKFLFLSVGDDHQQFSMIAKKIGLRQFLAIERVPQTAALNLMRTLDFGFVFIDEGYKLINSKFWELLALKIPMTAMVPADGAMAEYLDKMNAGYTLPYDVKSMAASWRTIFKDYDKGVKKIATEQDIAKHSSSNLTAKIATRIQSLCKE